MSIFRQRKAVIPTMLLDAGYRPKGLFQLLIKIAPNRVYVSILAGAFAGFGYSLIVPLVLLALAPVTNSTGSDGADVFLLGNLEVTHPRMALTFFLLCGVIMIGRFISVTCLQFVGIDAASQLRQYIYNRISQLPIEDLEFIGPSKPHTLLTVDIPRIIAGASFIPTIVINLFTCCGLLGFLVYLNARVFLFIVFAILFGFITYKIPMFLSRRYMANARNAFDKIQEGVRGLIYGAKELKINRSKRRSFIGEELTGNEMDSQENQKKAAVLNVFGRTYGDLISFLTIGFVTFAVANYFSITPEVTTGVVMALFYLSAPIGNLMNAVPSLIQAQVSLGRMNGMLKEMKIEKCEDRPGAIDCEELRLAGVTHCYRNDGDRPGFRLKPVYLTLRKGEVTFLVGGNGSGKTTLGKLISLHYIPQDGHIFFDDVAVNEDNREQCRQSISAIYSDFFLFTKLFGLKSQEIEALAETYLKDLGLDKKARIENGVFSTLKLSSGQRKRVALLLTFLEDRRVYLFDEWAADQDVEFKEVFYEQILSTLSRMGKIVVVITHDENYFHVADKVVHMSDGEISRVEVCETGQEQRAVKSVCSDLPA